MRALRNFLVLFFFAAVIAATTPSAFSAATVAQAPPIKFQFTDSAGLPLVGGKLFTYQAGTTTKQATYVDFGGSSQNTNPILLDARGQANIWLDITKTYKFVLAPATDTDPPTSPIWTVDNVSSPSASSISFVQSGSNVTALIVQDVLRNLYVEPESFGAVVYATKALADAGTDSTTAIDLALATGKNIKFRCGYYSTTGNHTVGTIGQRVEGCSQGNGGLSNNITGTVITKRSGTNPMFTLTQTNHYFGNIGLNGNNLGGSLLALNGVKYSTVERVTFTNQGGTDYALRLYGVGVVNLCSFRDLEFSGTNYAHIQADNVLYSDFTGIRAADTTSSVSIDIGLTQAVALTFTHTFTEGRVLVRANANSIRFFGLYQEALTADQAFYVSGALGVSLDGHYINRGASLQPVYDINNAAKNVSIRNAYIRDTGSLAGKVLASIDGGVFGFSFEDINIYSNNALTFLSMTGLRSDRGRLVNINSHSGGACTNILKGLDVTIENSNCAVNFATGGLRYTLKNVSGTITRTNAEQLTVINSSGDVFPITLFQANNATPSVIMGGSGGAMSFFRTQNSVPTTITAFADGANGEIIHVSFGDALTTVDFTGTVLKGNGAVDWTPAMDDSMICVFSGTNWYCSKN